MAMRRYEYYPAAAESIRAAAGQVRGGSTSLHTVIQQVEGEHRAAVDLTSGDLVAPMSQGFAGPYRLSSTVVRRSLWAAAQLETFADAIEVYNRDSSDPWSIEQLNAKADLGAAMYFCVKIPGADASPEERQDFAEQLPGLEAELQAILDGHFQRLEGNLDDAAAAAAGRLQQEPADADIVAAWKAGSLPAYAYLVWPGLNLRDIPVNGVNEDLFNLTVQQVIDRLKDPERSLSDAELEWLAVSYPEAMQRFHEKWTLEDTVLLPPDQPPAGHEAGSSEHGWILGPDGRWYPIQVPEASPVPPGSGPVVGETIGGLRSGNGNWVTLDSRQGPVYLGDGPPTGLLILSGMTGFTPSIHGNQSVGENQTDYLTYDQHGNVYTHQQASDRGPAWTAPPSVPDPELSNAPPGTWDPTTMDNPKLDRLNRGSALVDIGVGGLKGLQLSNQIDANSSYAGNVVFQTSGDERRAVIQLAQLTYDQDSGDLIEDPFRRYATAADINQERSGEPDVEEEEPRPTPTPTPRPAPTPDSKQPEPAPGPSPTPPR